MNEHRRDAQIHERSHHAGHDRHGGGHDGHAGHSVEMFRSKLIGAPIDFSIVRTVTVLVIACPHALGLAVPLVVAISTTLGARNGLLVRDRRGLGASRQGCRRPGRWQRVPYGRPGVASGRKRVCARRADRSRGSRRGPRPSRPRIIALSRATYRKMVQNLWWAAGYNVFAIPLAAGVLAAWGILLTPALGAVLMFASTVIVALNAQLLKRAEL